MGCLNPWIKNPIFSRSPSCKWLKQEYVFSQLAELQSGDFQEGSLIPPFFVIPNRIYWGLRSQKTTIF